MSEGDRFVIAAGCGFLLVVAYAALHWLAHQHELGVPWWAVHQVTRRVKRWALLKRQAKRRRRRRLFPDEGTS